MANVNKVSGLSPVKSLNGADWDGRGNMYFISSSDTNAYNPGDPVVLSGNGDTVKGIPGVTIGVAGSPIVGVFLAGGINADGGPYIDPNNLSLIGIPATKTKNYYCLVVDDPNVIFEIQEGGVGSALTSASIGNNANFHAGSPTSPAVYSGYYLDNNTVAGTSSLNLKLLGLARRSDNAFGAYAKWLVKINNHVYGSVGTAGI